MRCEPYLCVGGIEVANALRTQTYLRRGGGGSELSVGSSGVPAQAWPHQVIIGDVYEDVYSDVYGGSIITTYDQDAFTPQNLDGYCSAIDFSHDQPQLNYVDPVTDDAPWYQAAIPASAEFLGFYLEPRLDPVIARSVQARAPSGAAIGPAHFRQRVLNVTGTMYAATARGMAYGERWLTDVLSGAWCADSDLDEVLILPACPGAGDTADPFRMLRGTGCVDGPNFTNVIEKECILQSVNFQLVAESPFLWHAPETVLAAASGSLSKSVLVSTDAWGGDATLKITLTPHSTINGWRITGLPLKTDQSCPIATPWLFGPCFDYQIAALTVDQVLCIDGVTRQIAMKNQTTKRDDDGLPFVSFLGAPQLPDIAPCSRVCVTITPGTGSAAITVEKHTREL